MWKLSSGRYVEEELYELGKKLKYERQAYKNQYIKSFINYFHVKQMAVAFKFGNYDGNLNRVLFLVQYQIHSFILDVEDEAVLNHFSKEEMEEIDQTPGPVIPELAENVIDCLNKFVSKVNLSSIKISYLSTHC